MWLWVNLPLLILSAIAEGFLSETESEVFRCLLQALRTKSCLLAPEKVVEPSAAALVKSLSEGGISAAVLPKENLKRHLERTDPRDFPPTAIVLKERTLRTADYLENSRVVSSYLWFVFDTSNGTLRHDLHLLEIPFDCKFLLIEREDEKRYTIHEYYKIKKFSPGVLGLYALWQNDSLVFSQGWFDRKGNIQQHQFTTVKFSEDLYVTPKDKVNEEIWKELSIILNFTILNKVVNYSLENGHMDLEAEEDEALLDTQIYLGGRKNYTYLLGPTSETKLYMHVKVSGEDRGFHRFAKPFSRYTWAIVGVWTVTCGCAAFLVDNLLGRSKGNRNQQTESRLLIFTPLHSICNQSGSEVGAALASRLVNFSIRISGSVIYYAYAATFISYLLLFIPKLPFDDLKGLVEDGTYKVEGERNSDADTYFSVSSDPVEKLVYRKFFSDVKGWSRFDKGVDRMCAGEKLVLLGYDNDIDKYMPCNVVKIRKPLKVFANGFKLRFRSPFRGILHVKLLLMRDTGILQRVNSRIISTNANKFRPKATYEINIEKVHSVFILFGAGCSLSFGLLLLELAASSLKSGPNPFYFPQGFLLKKNCPRGRLALRPYKFLKI